VARYLVAKAGEPQKDDSLYTAAIVLMINSF
jgi:hypothetical protein